MGPQAVPSIPWQGDLWMTPLLYSSTFLPIPGSGGGKGSFKTSGWKTDASVQHLGKFNLFLINLVTFPWQYAVVKFHLNNGTTTIEYADKATETLDLHSVNGNLQGKGKKRISRTIETYLIFHWKRSEMRSLNLNSATHLNIQRKPLPMTSQCSLPLYKITNLFC